MNELLWSRALRAADARGLLPIERKSLTPRELAVHAVRHGDDRLALLVERWYYPASYGRIAGALTDDQAAGIVAALESEAELMKAQRVREDMRPAPIATAPRPRISYCDLCGRALV